MSAEKTAAVVDFKLTSGEVGENHRMQLAGYAVLVERGIRAVRAMTCFFYRIPDNKVYCECPITDELRERAVLEACDGDPQHAGDSGTAGADAGAGAMRGMRICELLRGCLVIVAD